MTRCRKSQNGDPRLTVFIGRSYLIQLTGGGAFFFFLFFVLPVLLVLLLLLVLEMFCACLLKAGKIIHFFYVFVCLFLTLECLHSPHPK